MTTSPDQLQLGLPGLGEAAKPQHRLFLGVLPDAAARTQTADVARQLQTAHALQARWVDPARYHVTLAFLGDHATLHPAVVEAAAAAASTLALAPFTWLPNQVDSFKGRRPPCVLRDAQPSRAMQALREQLRQALARQRLDRHMERSFQPHVTLAYAQHALLVPAPVTPVPWLVSRVVLLHSRIGTASYEELGSWPLPG